MRYYVRPILSHLNFKTREAAIAYMQNIPAYQAVKYWVAHTTNGLWHIYCNKGVYLDTQKLQAFPEPYQIILTEYGREF